MHKLTCVLARSLSLALSLAATGAAQTSNIVVPPSLANAPSWTSSGHPLGFTLPGRVQYCWDASETGVSAPTMLKGMALRAEESSINVAKTLTMAIEMSTTTQPATALSTTFATNRGVNHAIVFTAKPISLPPTPTGGFTGMWTTQMVYDTPFFYVPVAGNLLCEFDVSATATTNYTLDVTFTDNGHHFSVGAPCSSYAAGSTGGAIGATLTYSCTNGTPNAPAGAPGSVQVGAVPAQPFAWIRGCTVYLDPFVMVSLPGFLPAGPRWSQQLPIPSDPSLAGFRVVLQSAFLLLGPVPDIALTNGVYWTLGS